MERSRNDSIKKYVTFTANTKQRSGSTYQRKAAAWRTWYDLAALLSLRAWSPSCSWRRCWCPCIWWAACWRFPSDLQNEMRVTLSREDKLNCELSRPPRTRKLFSIRVFHEGLTWLAGKLTSAHFSASLSRGEARKSNWSSHESCKCCS